MTIVVPHFALPFRVAGGAVVVNEQDSSDEIADCMLAIASYTIGSRPEKPDFGVDDQAFRQGGADPAALAAAIDRWEPRARAVAAADNRSLAELAAAVTITTEEAS